jgi:hypothetical protein
MEDTEYLKGDTVIMNGISGTVTGHGEFGGLWIRLGESHYSQLHRDGYDFVCHAPPPIKPCGCGGCD